MNKKEILAKSKKENARGDERFKIIEAKADQMAFLAIEAVYAILIVILFIQKVVTGKAFANYQIFTFAFIVGFARRFATKYSYTKEKEWLFRLICCIMASLLCLVNIIGNGMAGSNDA